MTIAHLEHRDGFRVESPVVALPHVVLVCEVDHPALLDCLGAHPLGLQPSN